MTNETEAVRAGPIVADATISPHLANRVYGKRYGVDWIWHLDDVGLLHPQSEIDRLTGEVESERQLRLRAEGLCSAWIDRHDFALESLNEVIADRNATKARAESAERRVAELGAAMRGIVAFAKVLHVRWDDDEDMKVGKGLLAIAGVIPSYCDETRAFHAAIAPAKKVD